MLAKIVDTLPGRPGSPVTPFYLLLLILISKESTHFNLDYQSERASFVVHTDGLERDRGDIARKKAALASEAEAEKSATRKRVTAMLADEEDSEGDNLHVPSLQPLSDDNEEEVKEEEEDNCYPKRVVDNNEVVRGTDCSIVRTSMSTMTCSPSIISLPKSSTVKPKLCSMACPIIKHIASQAHKAMRLFTVTEKGFPNPLSCQAICWDFLVKATAADNDSGPVDKMKDIQDNQVVKSQLLQYMWKGSTHIRGELISKARISVLPMYGIKNIHKDKLSDTIHWTINSAAFINNSIDLKEKISDTTNLERMISSKFIFKHNSGVPKVKVENLVECSNSQRQHFLLAIFNVIVGQSDVSELMFDFDALKEAAKASKP
ncbi:hypothetical protein SERLADRAFT_404477 [Serpula lacrymans var. lacrymans S7.9]|uniref:DUF6532 domain-containing protein n=1 Tax=Serpula lacrymans var. lacrymans (strain S7.9) TaxID=578457 RepID=F8NDA7_SERL9|nr:uncharacterized protein SERLADRAFT_404477 [Serpula lacrymans var. lacrymans S7.9]EGO30191.1 hypothetical protein SERLADRAFT_404477 [Serpula lacrymans var. lacrymans S7.9]